MYSINYSQKVIETLAPDKRQPKTTAYLQQLAKEVSVNHNQLFNIYKRYQLASIWSAGSYSRYSTVRYGKAIYTSVEDTSDEPSFTNAWIMVSPNFMGNDFRLAITGEKLVLEYALNLWFDTTFRQLPSISDIYLVTNTIADSVFRIGKVEFESSKVNIDKSSEFVINTYSFTDQYNLTIMIPIVVFNSLGTTDEIRTSIVRSFADLYISAGITYKIQTY